MYIGSTGPSGLHHLVYEVVDNSVDEALAGYATRIDVTLLADGGCRVIDNGRGIPVDPHPEYPDKSAAEIVLTMLHAGRQVRRRGLQDLRRPARRRRVGRERALAAPRARDRARRRPLRDDVRRRRRARRAAERGRRLRRARAPPSRSGPTRTIMEEIEFRAQTLLERLREMAFLNKGLEIAFRDERVDPPTEQVFKYDGGIVDFVAHLNASKEPLFATGHRLHATPTTAARSTSRCSGTPASTKACTRSRTTSPPPRAACTRRASRSRSPTS